MKNELKHALLGVLVLFLSASMAFGQGKRTVSGVVRDSTGTGIPAVTVSEKGKRTTTVTDQNGKFSISTQSDQPVLVFSSIGFTAKEVSVGSSSNIDVSLMTAAAELNEVVVTALGITKATKELGYSVQKVGAADINKAAPPNVAQGLMGKVAGLNISVPSGVEGSSQRIVIRGNNVLMGNNQPLYVIDGVQMSSGQMGLNQSDGTGFSLTNATYTAGDIATQKDWGSPLNFLNSDDIEEVNVLKGPTAAALYGARGANGVVLITTKKGNRKEGFGIEYNVASRWTKAYRFQEYQHEYGSGGAIGLWTADENLKLPKDANGNFRYPAEAPWSGAAVDGKYTQFGPLPGGKNYWDYFSWPGAGLSWGAKMDGRSVLWWDGTTRPYSYTPDQEETFFRTGNTTDHNLAFSTGGDFGSLRVSLGRTDNKSIMYNSNFDQTSVNVGTALNITKKLHADATASYVRYNRLNTPSMGDNNSVAKFLTYGFPMDFVQIEKNVYENADGSKNMFDNNAYPLTYPYSSYTNLWWSIYNQNTTLQRDQLIGSVKLSADFTPWLNLMGRTGVNMASNEFENKNKPTDAAGYQGSYSFELNKDYTITSEAMATLHKDNLFSDFDASLSAGVSSWYNRFRGSRSTNNGPFADPFLYYLQNTTATVNRNWLPTDYRLESKINSVYGLLNLSYKNFLFLEATGRNDWSSTLPSNANSYFYPSASLSFAFTDAFDMGSAKNWLSFGKVRVAYAGSANGTDPYQTTNVYNSGSFGGAVTRSLPTRLYPTDLVPQRSKSYEVGTQLVFFKNRLSVDFTYYKINSTNQILNAPLATSSGFDQRTFNTGELENQGFEFIVKARPVEGKNFSWDVILNGAHNNNKVISLDEGIDKFYLGTIFGDRTGASMFVKVGDNYGTIYGLDYTYLNGEKVVRKLTDANGNVVGTQYVTTSDPVAIGNATPKLTGGLMNQFHLGAFSLSFLTDFKLGGDLYSFDYASAMGEGKAPETLVERNGGGLPYTYPDGTTANHGVILDGVFADGKKNTDVVNYMFKYAGQYAAWTNVDMPRSNAVFENTWVKLRELTLSYDIPKRITSATKIFQGLSLSLVGRDLFYFYSSLPDNLNPEGVNGVGNLQGFQWAAMPGSRSIGFAIRAKF